MPEAVVRTGGRNDQLVIRINGDDPTFHLATDTLEAQALQELDPVLLDLLEISATVFAADSSVVRGGPTRQHMGQRWYREFDVTIPVRNPGLWRQPEVSAALVEAVESLTEDSVRFAFTQARAAPSRQPYLNFGRGRATFQADEVVLFSGGLDSFAGALELLSASSSRVILITHRSAQKAITRQVDLGRYLVDRFPGRVLHVQVLARRKGQEARDQTQRSRTLLFAALGQAVAHAFGAKRVSFFENGIVSHNLPLSPQIVSTMATRTTHPLALRIIDRLTQLVAPSPVPIENRYQWLTKSEVVSRIAESGAAEQIRRAVSCTSVREQNNLHTHCGACTQCLDRRFAVLHAGLGEHDPEEIYATDVLVGERRTPRSIVMATEWTRHALRLGELDQQGFMESYGTEAMRIVRGHPELTRKEALDLTFRMHQRHSRAVRRVLENVVRDRAPDLIAGKLSETCLLRLHVGPGDAQRLAVPGHQQEQAPRPAIDVVDEVDLVPRPEDPLRVAFSVEGQRQIVDVVGLASIAGPPARVPHALKPIFDEDRCRGASPEEHRYQVGTQLPELGHMNKETIRKSVQRCRNQIAEGYERLHGEPPSGDLLIQTKPSLGYRLDPTIIVVSATRRA